MNDRRASLQAALGAAYAIERELGAGGMATVYLARDLKHDRRVALKVLKPELAAVVGAERFLSEIKTTANLQHPHILALFDSGVVDGTVFYAMPYVEGESLRDRLNREKQLPLNDTLRIAREVADALHHAHSHGVIHRDIKPENILLQGGHALVADFGIALAASSAGGSRMTETGMSLGTPAYMSPEQAMGERALDARTDVYALGCVVYEMLAGEPPFTGPTAQAIVARVITEEPRSLRAQRKTVPVEVDDAVTTALAKLPADRFASAAAFAEALQGGGTLRSYQMTGARVGARARARTPWLVPALGIALMVSAALAAWGWSRQAPAAAVTRTFVDFPDAEAPRMQRPSYALLPDGSAMVYVGHATAGGTQLWIKKRSELHATPLGGTAGASTVFVSPNGESIGFIVASKILKMPVSGGQAVVLGDAVCATLGCRTYPSGAFLDDGRVITYSAEALVALGPNAGTVDSLVTSPAIGGFTPLYPTALPGSRGVLFTACTNYCNKADLWVVEVATKKARRLIEHASRPVYVAATGHLLYLNQQGAAFAVPFDPDAMTVRGPATRVLDRVVGGLAVSRDGTLLYAEGDPSPRSDVVVVSRDGSQQPIDTTWRGDFATLAVSPDGKRLAASIVTVGEEHLWVKALGGGPPSRLTFDKAQYTTPTWSADGLSLLYTRFSGDTSTFLSRRADGTGGAVVLQEGAHWVIESVVSRDGEWLVLREYRPDGSRDIFARRLRGDTSLRPVVATPVSDFSPALSPDGKWLAYVNSESGQPEVWVVPFPEPGSARWQVSHDGGTEPSWSHDGHQLFYVSDQRALVSVSVGAGGSSFRVGQHRNLFSVAPYRRHPTHRAYDVLPGTRGFVMIRDGSPTTGELVLVDHWFTELSQKARAP